MRKNDTMTLPLVILLAMVLAFPALGMAAEAAAAGAKAAKPETAKPAPAAGPQHKGWWALGIEHDWGPLPGHLDRGYQGDPIPAFPGAEGWGSDTSGGRGGKVMIVTNLNPDGPGSMQEACAAEGPRIVVFGVSGVISNTITIEHSNITIAGQTAPGAGITIEGLLVAKPGIRDLVVRFVRVRPRPAERVIFPDQAGGGALATRLRQIGVEMKNAEENWFADYDAIKFSGISHVVLDHLSCSWSHDELIEFCYTHHVTVQWCTLEETDVGKHQKYGGHHNFGLFCAYNRKDFISLHHNLLANSSRRNPAIRDGMADVRNNVVYNFRSGMSHDTRGHNDFNIIGNVFLSGPCNKTATPATARWAGKPGNPLELTPKTASYFLRDNWMDGKPVEFVLDQPRQEPFAMPPVTTLAADKVLAAVLARAGAFPCDAVTRRTIEEVRTGTGAWGRREPKGGLMEGLTPGVAPLDTDKDGMPDEWEKKHGLDPAKDDSAKVMPSGYTAIEVYVNELAERIVNDR
jgi:pectate lyase